MLNSISTLQSARFTELTNCDLLIFLNGLLNNPKQSASNIVDFPAPFSPMIKVLLCLLRLISVKKRSAGF